MEAEHDTIRAAFVDAYPRYVASVLASRGIEIDDVIADAIVEGTSVLDGLLATFETTELVEQTSSPLELFREALRPIDRALTLVGAPEPRPGSGPSTIVPWDRYAISPGSSSVLGERAKQAHIMWGLGKAKAVARFVDSTQGPNLGILCPDGDRAGLVVQAEALAYRTVMLPSGTDVSVAIVCAEEAGADALVRSLAPTARVIVYGRSIDDIDQVRFASLGAKSVVDAHTLFESFAEYLPAIT